MKRVVAFFLDQEVLVNVSFLVIILLGLYALFDMPVERYPNVHMGKVLISTYYPGASPEEVEALVTREIEDALDDLEYVEFIQSTSYRERSSVTVKFVDDSDYAALFDELRLKVLGVMNELPAGIDPPDFTLVDVKEWLPVVNVNLVGERSNRALSLMAEEMRIPLSQIEGVEDVELQGEYVREFHVFLDPVRMDAFGLTFEAVAAALASANVSIPAGSYTDETGEYVVVVDERFRSREQVVETIVRRDADGSFVTVGDVMAEARMSYRDPFVITSVNGRDSVNLKVVKTDAGNAMDIGPAVEAVVERFRQQLSREGVEVVLTQDQRIHISDSINTLGMNLLVGIALVAVLIFFFMGFRNAVLTTAGIPFSFLVTMVLMYFTGNSLNEITLFSFVLVSGIIVDDAIVVVENIYRHLQEGRPLRAAIIEGASEVATPVISATSTTVAAFLPMLIMTGSTGEFFGQIPVAISYAIAASLIECLIILPPHFLSWPGAHGAEFEASRHGEGKERGVMRAIRASTSGIVAFTQRFRFTSLGLVLLAFCAAVFILVVSISGRMQLIRIEFFPDEFTAFWVDLEGPSSTPVETTSARLKGMSEFLLSLGPGQVRSATSQAGLYVNEDYEPVYGSNYGHIQVEIPVKEKQRFADYPENDPMDHLARVRDEVRARYEGEGWQVRVRAEKGGPPAGKDVNIRVVGPNPDSVLALSEEILGFLRQNPELSPHLTDLTDDQGQLTRVYRFRVREALAAEYGLGNTQVAALAGSVLDGRYIGEFRTPDEDVDLKLRVDRSFLDSPEAALAIPVLQHPTGPVRLGDLTRVESYFEPGHISRYQNNRAVTITANIGAGAPISPPLVVQQVSTHYRDIKQGYPGAELSFAGEFESTRKSYTSLMWAFLIAIMIIYMILATQFRSYLQPLIVISAVVFSLIGVVFGKFLTQSLFTVNSFIAAVGVTGVVVNDSLVLIDFINRGFARGLSRREAIQEGIRIRLRPILLTTLTTTLGLLPMALGFPSYSQVWGTMASTFVTGLCTATFLTLFIVPIEWDLLMGLSLRLKERKRRRLERKGYLPREENSENR